MGMDEEMQHRSVRYTSDEINQQVQDEIEQSLSYYSDHPDQIEERLQALSKEWNLDRWLQANASVFALLGLGLSQVGSRKWLLLPALVSAFLFQHSVQGWCPPVHLFRQLGVRTKEEILREYYLLRALQGYFEDAGARSNGKEEVQSEGQEG